jgi:hypothetical protein
VAQLGIGAVWNGFLFGFVAFGSWATPPHPLRLSGWNRVFVLFVKQEGSDLAYVCVWLSLLWLRTDSSCCMAAVCTRFRCPAFVSISQPSVAGMAWQHHTAYLFTLVQPAVHPGLQVVMFCAGGAALLVVLSPTLCVLTRTRDCALVCVSARTGHLQTPVGQQARQFRAVAWCLAFD